MVVAQIHPCVISTDTLHKNLAQNFGKYCSGQLSTSVSKIDHALEDGF